MFLLHYLLFSLCVRQYSKIIVFQQPKVGSETKIHWQNEEKQTLVNKTSLASTCLRAKLASFNSLQEFQLLCPNGNRAPLTEYESCHLAWNPSRSLVVSCKVRTGDDVNVPFSIVELLHVAQVGRQHFPCY